MVDCQEKFKSVLNNIFSTLITYLSRDLVAFLQIEHGRQTVIFDLCHQKSVTCGVTSGFEISSGCRPWLKNVFLYNTFATPRF